MSVIMFGDFVGYSTDQLSRYFLSNSGGAVTSSGGRFNSAYYATSSSSNSGMRSRAFTPLSSGVIGGSFYFPPGLTTVLSLMQASAEHLRLSRNADGTLSLSRAGTALTGGTTINSFADNIWHWIEIKFSIADSIGANSCQIYVNGGLEATVATGQDTRNGSDATINSFVVGRIINNSGASLMRFGEFYIDNSTTPLGDRRVETLFPNGNGATQDFTSSSGGHYTDVDDTTADDDSTYVESATAGDIELFTVQNMSSTPTDITAASIWSCVRKTDAGEKSCAAVLRQSATNYDQATHYPGTDYEYDTPIMLVDPATASAWTESGINSCEIGLKVVS